MEDGMLSDKDKIRLLQAQVSVLLFTVSLIASHAGSGKKVSEVLKMLSSVLKISSVTNIDPKIEHMLKHLRDWGGALPLEELDGAFQMMTKLLDKDEVILRDD